MNELRIIENKGLLTVDSRDVADFLGKTHKNLLRDIRKYTEILTGSKLSPSDFFTKSNYVDVKGEERESYLLTRKGCDMVAHKMTGEKGVIFTAAYIDTFYKYEEHLKPRINHYNDDISLRKAELLLKVADDVENPSYKQILQAYATKEIEGEFILPLPLLERKTLSATEVGEVLGISSNKVGSIANKNDLKTKEYGEWYKDKSPYSAKQVETFRYYENVIPVFRDLLESENKK